jgi:hypothetical protein
MSTRHPPYFYPNEKDPHVNYTEWIIWMSLQECWDYQPEFSNDHDYQNTDTSCTQLVRPAGS